MDDDIDGATAQETNGNWESQQNILEIMAQVCDGQNREMQDFFREHTANGLVCIT